MSIQKKSFGLHSDLVQPGHLPVISLSVPEQSTVTRDLRFTDLVRFGPHAPPTASALLEAQAI